MRDHPAATLQERERREQLGAQGNSLGADIQPAADLLRGALLGLSGTRPTRERGLRRAARAPLQLAVSEVGARRLAVPLGLRQVRGVIPVITITLARTV